MSRALILLLIITFGSYNSFGQFAGGSGTVADPFQIATIEQLQAIKDAPNTSQFILINDIDASQTASWNGGQGFDPIGWFAGSLDGQGYRISDLTINRPGVHQTALFTHIGSNAVLKNFHLENVSINGGSRTGAVSGTVAGQIEHITVSGIIQGTGTVGGVAGQVDSNGSVIGCHVDVNVTGRSHMIGGLIGNNNGGTLENNSSEGSVSGQNRTGGLVGSNAGPLSHSHSSSAVNGEVNVGGLVGFNHNTTIEACYSTGSVSGIENVGGLAGFAGWHGSIIRLSFSSANVEGTNNQVGGLIGRLQSGTVENTYARGDVDGNNRVGGLVGEILFGAIINNSFSAGLVTGSGGQIGGLIGRDQGSSTHDSFWDEETSGQASSEGGTGKTTAEMLTQSTFTGAGWDFNEIWSMDAAINDGYPYLTPLPPVVITQTYFSRTNGNWNVPDTWSTTDHNGAAATQSPGANDNAIVAANHTVTLTSNVANNGVITIDNTGTLVTNEFHISGTGNFVLAPGGTLHIGSEEGISESGGSGSIKTVNRSFSSLANYVYDGILPQETGNGLPAEVNSLRIDNSAGITASANLTGLTVNGQLQLDNGIFTMPPGSSLVANSVDKTNGNIRMQLTINGEKGWRMITSPVQTNLDDLLDGFVSQGFTGSSFPNKQPNILWFDETQIGTTNMSWRAPTSISNDIAGGRGYFHYIFNGAEMSENGNGSGQFYADTLPITMKATGLEHATGGSIFDFDVTHTPRSESNITDTDIPEMNTGWNLVGNPSTASLNWNAASGWTRINVDETIYIWDPAANGGEGDFLFWNGSTGTLGNGLIAPFQAFWVKANSSSPVLNMTDDVKTTGGTFRGTGFNNKSQEQLVTSTDFILKLEADGMESTAFISFSEHGMMGEDPRDAFRLEPLGKNWLKLYTTAPCCQWPLVINHLPDQLNNILHIPIYVDGQRNNAPLGGTYKLSWTMPENWPMHWQAVLMDHARQTATPINDPAGSISFTVNQTHHNSAIGTGSDNQLHMPESLVVPVASPDTSQGNNASGDNQISLRTTQVNISPSFSIVIYPGELPENIEYMAPEPILLPVYPNPMRDRANIRFNLPDHAKVSLDVFDIHGRRVQRLAERHYGPGIHALTWSPGRISPGIYFLVLQTEETLKTEKLIVR